MSVTVACMQCIDVLLGSVNKGNRLRVALSWLLSGSFFPVPESGWLSWVMRLNPLTYGVAGLRRLMSPTLAEVAASSSFPSLWVCLAATCGFCVLTVTLACWLTHRRSVINVR